MLTLADMQPYPVPCWNGFFALCRIGVDTATPYPKR